MSDLLGHAEENHDNKRVPTSFLFGLYYHRVAIGQQRMSNVSQETGVEAITAARSEFRFVNIENLSEPRRI